MKVKRILPVLVSLCVLLCFFSCKGEVQVSTPNVTETVLIPENKTGVVFSNPFKDTTKFEARSVIYYSKYDVDYYKISVWYLDGLSDGEEPTASNTIAELKITKDDTYTAKTLTFDNEGQYSFSCSAFTSDNEQIAEDTVKKSLTFATAEFIIFYLVPKIKLQTADVSASITWSGDDLTAVAHTVRFVRPYDGLDTTLTILQNGKCNYNDDAYMPIVTHNGNWSNLKPGKVALSDCNVSCMVGKNGESYSFSLQISVSSDAQVNAYWTNLLNWVRPYSEDNALIAASESLSYNMNTSELKGKGDFWILLDDKIVSTSYAYGYEGQYSDVYYNKYSDGTQELYRNMPYTTAGEIKSAYYRIDEYGNILTLGDYVETTCGGYYSYDCYGRNSEYLIGSRLWIGDSVDSSEYANTIYYIDGEEPHTGCAYHYVIFKANRTPYTF